MTNKAHGTMEYDAHRTMKFSTYASSLADISACANSPNLGEVLIEPSSLAREGQISMASAIELAQAAYENGLRPVLVWDALMPQRVMEEVLRSVSLAQLAQFSAVRVSDPGVAYWLLEHAPNLPLHYIVETGSHNIEALRGWQEALRPTLERFVLSIELPEEKLIEYCQSLSVGCEVLGAGRILLFYSPRSLTAQHLLIDSTAIDSTAIDSTGTDSADRESVSSADSLHLDGAVRPQKSLNRAFPTLETVHGTFMYLDKDQFILDRLEPLRDAGLAMLRIDLRHLSSEGNSALQIEEVCSQIFSAPAELRDTWPRPTRAPFFKTNRTTAQFSRMKSFLHELRDERCLAEIIGGDNGKYVVYQVLRSFDVSEAAAIMLPTGEEVPVPSRTVFRNRDGEEIRNCRTDDIIVSGWIKKAASGSILYTGTV